MEKAGCMGDPASMMYRRWGEMEELEVARGTWGGANSGSS